MSEPTTKPAEPCTPSEPAKPGFFGRILEKIDASMKQKADEKSEEGGCCGGSEGKGGKCC